MKFKPQMSIIDNPKTVQQSLYNLKTFMQERTIHQFKFNYQLKNYWLDFSIPIHTFINNDWKIIDFHFTIFVLSNGRLRAYLLVEMFLEDGFDIDVDELTIIDSRIEKIFLNESIHLCNIFINPHQFTDALETMSMASYEAIQEGQENVEYIHGLAN